MANATIVDVAEAIKEAIKGHEWLIRELCVERSYANVRQKLEDLDTVRIDVVPWNSQPEIDSVGTFLWPCEVDILIRRRNTANEQNPSGELRKEEIDLLMRLVQDVYEFFLPSQATDPEQTGRLVTFDEAHWEETRMIAHYVRSHLAELRQFTGWIRLTYSVGKVPG